MSSAQIQIEATVVVRSEIAVDKDLAILNSDKARPILFTAALSRCRQETALADWASVSILASGEWPINRRHRQASDCFLPRPLSDWVVATGRRRRIEAAMLDLDPGGNNKTLSGIASSMQTEDQPELALTY